MDFTVIIPARYAASRLPGKPLADVAGKPLIQRVVEAAASSAARNIVVATDDQRIMDCVASFGAKAVMTAADHPSGSDRIAEACERLGLADDELVVNLQGDEPDMPGAVIDQVAGLLVARPQAVMATLAQQIEDTALLDDPNVVKVVCGAEDNALYFSRAAIPFNRDGLALSEYPVKAMRHLGIYAYRAGYIREFSGREECPLEQTEKLEQLRVLHYGERIACTAACADTGIGVDTPADLAAAQDYFAAL